MGDFIENHKSVNTSSIATILQDTQKQVALRSSFNAENDDEYIIKYNMTRTQQPRMKNKAKSLAYAEASVATSVTQEDDSLLQRLENSDIRIEGTEKVVRVEYTTDNEEENVNAPAIVE